MVAHSYSSVFCCPYTGICQPQQALLVVGKHSFSVVISLSTAFNMAQQIEQRRRRVDEIPYGVA